jgi:methylmalonyl-CoA/ethylmalonyl-CoA epimerase
LIAFVLLCFTTAFAQQPAQSPFPPPTGSYFAISVHDLNATAEWYKQKLGFREVKQSASRDGLARAIILEGDGVLVEVVHHKRAVSPRTLIKGYKDAYQIYGVFKVGLMVQDVDHTLQRLKANGVAIANGPFNDDALHLRSFFIRDNEGNIIQFFSRLGG